MWEFITWLWPWVMYAGGAYAIGGALTDNDTDPVLFALGAILIRNGVGF